MQYDYAGVVWRLGAALIDSVVLWIPNVIIIFLLGGLTSAGFELQGIRALIFMLVGLLIYLGYFIGMEITRGATLGKMLLQMRVVKVDGAPVDAQTSAIRNLVRIVEAGCCILIPLILIIQSPRRQRLGDRLANTTVVRKTT